MNTEHEKWRKYELTKDVNLQNELFLQYQEWAEWLAHALYKKIYLEGIEVEEFEQYAYEGLLRSIAKFDLTKKTQFKTFAEYRIKGNILNHLPKLSESSAIYNKNKIISFDLDEDKNQEPILSLINIVNDLSIQYFFNYEDSNHNAYQGDFYSSPEIHTVFNRVNEIIKLLKEPKKGIITSYYKKGWSFAFIANLLELTKGRVSQLHTQALKEIKETLGW